MKNTNDDLSRFWLITSNAMPLVGLLLYLRHRKNAPNKAKRALLSAAMGLPPAIVAGYLMETYILG
jgi:hypothetical protein